MILRSILSALALLLYAPAVIASADFYRAMSELYERKAYSEIEKECGNELEHNGSSLDAYYFLVLISNDRGRYEQAERYLERFREHHEEVEKKLSPDRGLIDCRFTRLYRDIGKRYYLKKDYQQAIFWLEKAKSAYYNDVMLNFFLGKSHQERREFGEALRYLQRMLENRPDEPVAYYHIAQIHAVSGAPSDALFWLKKAIESFPDFKQAARHDLSFQKLRNYREFKSMIRD